MFLGLVTVHPDSYRLMHADIAGLWYLQLPAPEDAELRLHGLHRCFRRILLVYMNHVDIFVRDSLKKGIYWQMISQKDNKCTFRANVMCISAVQYYYCGNISGAAGAQLPWTKIFRGIFLG